MGCEENCECNDWLKICNDIFPKPGLVLNIITKEVRNKLQMFLFVDLVSSMVKFVISKKVGFESYLK